MRLRSIGLATVVGLVVAAALHSGALVFATLAAAAVAALITVSRRRLFRAVTFERTAARRVVPWGGRLEVTVSVTNAKLLPLVWMRIHDEWPLGLAPHGFTLQPSTARRCQYLWQTVSLRWYERVRRHYLVDCMQRGLHRFGPAELEAGDPFGIAGVVRNVPEREEIVVLPRVLDVPDLEAVSGRPLVEEAALRSLTTDPTALRGTRPYQPGDPLRAVNWRATARRAALHTNEFEPAAVAAVRLLLDVGVLEQAWMGVDPERVELLCVVTASLAAAFAGRGFRVGLASNARLAGDWRAVDIEPQEGALDDVLETLGRLLVYPPDDFSRVLAAELRAESDTADCVIVVPALRRPVRDLVRQLRAERPTTVVFVGDPSPEERGLVDAVVPADYDWEGSRALSLL